MPIVVAVIEFPEGTSLSESSMTFGDQGGAIGRSDSNTWVLPDPNRFLSGCHCQIVAEGGSYYLIDTSTNGTFVNGSSEPLGKGNRTKLNHGDMFELSDYKFQAQLLDSEPAVQQPANLGTAGSVDLDDPFSMPAAPVAPAIPAEPFGSDPFASAPPSPIPMDLPIDTPTEETDPLAMLDKSSQLPEASVIPDDPFNQSYSDNASATGEAIAWPEAAPQSGLIPENWDDDWLDDAPAAPAKAEPAPIAAAPIKQTAPLPQAAPAQPAIQPVQIQPAADDPNTISLADSEARRRALEQANRKMKAELAQLKKQLAAKKSAPSANVDTGIVDAIGFGESVLSDAKVEEINDVAGKLIRLVVEGMMQTLASRNDIKNTFRMNMTTIQPIENNPLKFSANVNDALENMFIKEGNSYKKPVDAVREGFESIADHQVAILAGIRSAFISVVNRFEPGTLRSRFDKQGKRSLIALNEKAKYWDAFIEYYSELFSDLDKSFQYLFGDEFTQAYEEQLQTLSMARKEKEKSTKLRK